MSFMVLGIGTARSLEGEVASGEQAAIASAETMAKIVGVFVFIKASGSLFISIQVSLVNPNLVRIFSVGCGALSNLFPVILPAFSCAEN